MPATSKLTSKYQATIPKEIREILGLDRGDSVLFEIEDGAVRLRRLTAMDVEYLRATESTLSEWTSDFDEQAYAEL